MASATVGETARNVIPTVAEASIDIRLVKGNDPESMLELVERHIERQGYRIVRDDPDHAARLAHPLLARVTRRHGYAAVRTSMDLPVLQPVIEAAGVAAVSLTKNNLSWHLTEKKDPRFQQHKEQQ